ncbi:MAG: hypothetical protein ACRDNS_07720, partial [Trebonia sp.]
MNTSPRGARDLESQIRAALHAEVASITPATLRHPLMPRPKRRAASPLAAVVAVITLCAVSAGTAAVVYSSRGGTESHTAAATAVVTDGVLHIAGITMPVPDGWSVRALPRRASGTSLCLTPPNPTKSEADPAHPTCDGITLTVADTARDGTASTLPFAGAGSCPAGQPHTLTYDDEGVTLGGRRADLFKSSCGT